MAISERSFEYDVFLSYSSNDKPFVRDLAQRLTSDGLRVWFDDWEVKPGDLIGLKIENGLERSRTLILVISPTALKSDWVALERHTAIFRDPTNADRRFIPLLLEDIALNDTLKQFAHIDWRSRSDKEYQRLLTSVRTASPPRTSHEHSRLSSNDWSIWGVAATPNGRLAISGHHDARVKVWNVNTKGCVADLLGHRGTVLSVSITPDGRRAASGSSDSTIRVWDLTRNECMRTIGSEGVKSFSGIAITDDGQKVIAGCKDGSVRVWSIESGACETILLEHTEEVTSIATTSDGKLIVSGSADGSVKVWLDHQKNSIMTFGGHRDRVTGVALARAPELIISGSLDRTLRVWDIKSRKPLAVLEGHTLGVTGVAVTADGERAISSSLDNTVKLWETATGACVLSLTEHSGPTKGVALTADGRRAVSVSVDTTVRVWDLPSRDVAKVSHEDLSARYTNAKVVMVGDSGVGKTGLAIRLKKDRFELTSSSDAVWATQLIIESGQVNAEVQREIWLWDFAGQADYRLIHQLFLDEASIAVLVFNPQAEDPFEGLEQWNHAIERAARRPLNKILVSGRCDRGGPMVSPSLIDRFVREHGFAVYVETSAMSGRGCTELHRAIVEHIPWDQIPWTASPRIFKSLKEGIVRLRDEGKVLLRIVELKQQLELSLPSERFSLDDLYAVLGLLAGPGVVWKLEFGDFVLLQPELINAYASAVVRSIRADPDDVGAILEDRVLGADLDFQDLPRLPQREESVVLRAMHQTMVNHGLCLREHTDVGTWLVFPSHFKRERPEVQELPPALVLYEFGGTAEEAYATLVVKLNHTTPFERRSLWRFAADFSTETGKQIAVKLTKKDNARSEFAVYADPTIPVDTKVTFMKYVHRHLERYDPKVLRVRQYSCSNCGAQVEDRRAISERLKLGLTDIVCATCEARVQLKDSIENKFASDDFNLRSQVLDNQIVHQMSVENQALLMVAHAFAVSAEAEQHFRLTQPAQFGIDGEIQLNEPGRAPHGELVLQLLTVPGHAYSFDVSGPTITIELLNEAYSHLWLNNPNPVMLVVRAGDASIHWMDVRPVLKAQLKAQKKFTTRFIFSGEPFTALNLRRMRDALLLTGKTAS